MRQAEVVVVVIDWFVEKTELKQAEVVVVVIDWFVERTELQTS